MVNSNLPPESQSWGREIENRLRDLEIKSARTDLILKTSATSVGAVQAAVRGVLDQQTFLEDQQTSLEDQQIALTTAQETLGVVVGELNSTQSTLSSTQNTLATAVTDLQKLSMTSTTSVAETSWSVGANVRTGWQVGYPRTDFTVTGSKAVILATAYASWYGNKSGVEMAYRILDSNSNDVVALGDGIAAQASTGMSGEDAEQTLTLIDTATLSPGDYSVRIYYRGSAGVSAAASGSYKNRGLIVLTY